MGWVSNDINWFITLVVSIPDARPLIDISPEVEVADELPMLASPVLVIGVSVGAVVVVPVTAVVAIASIPSIVVDLAYLSGLSENTLALSLEWRKTTENLRRHTSRKMLRCAMV
jgi:hypothetical protein